MPDQVRHDGVGIFYCHIDKRCFSILVQKLIKLLVTEGNLSLLKQGYYKIAQLFQLFYPCKRKTLYLEALSPKEVQSQLKSMGLDRGWIFSDFDEVVIEESSQSLWAKIIIRNKTASLPRIFLKYIRYFKWKENLYELNKIFKYSDGLNELKNKIVLHLTLNDNFVKMLSSLREKKIVQAGIIGKIVYKYFPPIVNLVIVSSNTGGLIKLFLDREDIQKHLRENKIIVQAVVANKMGFNGKSNIIGLCHEKNIIDIDTKKNYIPKSNIVLVDKRDSHLKRSHSHTILVPPHCCQSG